MANAVEIASYDDTGQLINPNAYAHTLAYTNGVVTTDVFTDGKNTYTQTFTYTAGNLTGISKWVKS